MLNYEHLTRIILKSCRNEASEEEKAELKAWLDADPKNREMIENFQNPDWVMPQLKERENIDEDKAKQKLWAKMGWSLHPGTE